MSSGMPVISTLRARQTPMTPPMAMAMYMAIADPICGPVVAMSV